MKNSTIAILALTLVAAMWGLTFPLMHDVMPIVDSGLFVTVRLIFASVVMLPFVIFRFKHTNRFLIIGCIVLAALNTATYLFQTKGLLTIPASRSAFITGVSVVIVPFLMPLFRLGNPDKFAFISVAICLVGLYILTGADLRNLTIGDFWTLDCAISYGFFIVVMQIMSSRVKDYLLLCFFQVFFSVPLALPFATTFHLNIILQPEVIGTLLFCAVFATTIAIYLQGRYQQYVSAAQTALIFALEPVFATIAAYFINNAAITYSTIIGGMLVLLSIVFRDLCVLGTSKKTSG